MKIGPKNPNYNTPEPDQIPTDKTSNFRASNDKPLKGQSFTQTESFKNFIENQKRNFEINTFDNEGAARNWLANIETKAVAFWSDGNSDKVFFLFKNQITPGAVTHESDSQPYEYTPNPNLPIEKRFTPAANTQELSKSQPAVTPQEVDPKKKTLLEEDHHH